MHQKELLDSIKKYLARFEVQVRISTANNEYDINIHAENVIIPILNLLFDSNLKNANFSEGKNNEALDLIDEDKKIAFQVTSTKGIEKIKSTLSKFVSSKFKNKIDKLYVYLISEKQQSYTQHILDKAADKKINFNAKENILDSTDIYRRLYELNDLEIISKIEDILRKQFSDIYIDKNFTLDQFEDFKIRYKQSCIANFSRINFFGLSVSTNRPREIQLYLLFVRPTFSSNDRSDFYYFRSKYDSLILENHINDRFTSAYVEAFETVKASEKYRTLLKDLDVSQYFTDKIVRLGDSISLTNFENFHTGLQKSVEVKFEELFSGAKNIVVIGKPGAGKSSFIKYSICKILEKDTSVFSNKAIYDFIPFRIELHKYNKFKKTKLGGLVEYLNELLKSEYQQIINVDTIIAIIKSFPSLFFFDGLDEIFDIQERLDVRNDIETFVKSYDVIRSVVTSRYESYEEVSLSERHFTKYELLDFDDEQVKQYVTKWYTIEELSSTVRERETINCLDQLKTVEPELKHNPLLLSLILLLYRNELDIPTSKLSIYESCTNTIVETRDVKEKKLDINLKIVNKTSVFTSLAYWQFKNESLGNSSPTFEAVRQYIKQYLIEKGEFTDEVFAQQATDEFLDFAKIRSIYFENKFTHKTFLEYFTAYYIYSYYYGNWRKAEMFSELLENYVGLSAWSVVLELLICKIDSTQINYEVIDDLVEKLYSKNKIDTLIFLLQLLKYLRNISPKITKFIIIKSIEFCFKDGEHSKELKTDYREALFAHLSNLGSSDRFKEVIENSFTEIAKKNTISDLYVNAFAYEFAIVSGNTSLVKILQENNLESNAEYIFILKHYPNLFDNTKFLESLKIFMASFQINKTSEVYESLFGQKIFFNSTKFNWTVTFLINNLSNEKAYTCFQQLLEAGVPKEILITSANKKSADVPVSELLEKVKITHEKDSTFKKFIRNLQATYLPPPATRDTKKGSKTGNFYDKFYIPKHTKRS